MASKGVLTVELAPRSLDVEGFLSMLREKFPELTTQIFSLKSVPNRRVIELVAHQTMMAARKRSLLASKPEVDLLLRVAGTTQIGAALEKVGYRGEGKKVLVAIGEERLLARLKRYCDGRLPGSRQVKSSPMSANDFEKVELAALLNIGRD